MAALPPGGWLLMQGNLAPAATLAACRAARDRGVAVMVNTAPLPWDMRSVLPFCAVAVANAAEAAVLTRLHPGPKQRRACGNPGPRWPS